MQGNSKQVSHTPERTITWKKFARTRYNNNWSSYQDQGPWGRWRKSAGWGIRRRHPPSPPPPTASQGNLQNQTLIVRVAHSRHPSLFSIARRSKPTPNRTETGGKGSNRVLRSLASAGTSLLPPSPPPPPPFSISLAASNSASRVLVTFSRGLLPGLGT